MSPIVKSTWREARLTVPANTPTPFTFRDTDPNLLFIANNSNTRVYVSTSPLVSLSTYDLIVPPYGTRRLARPDPLGTVWFYAQVDANLFLASMEADFSPLLVPETQEISAVGAGGLLGTVDVNAILNPLPAGNAKIGQVDISGFGVPLPAGPNLIGRVRLRNPQDTADLGDAVNPLVVTTQGMAADGAAALPALLHVLGGWDGLNVRAVRVSPEGYVVANDLSLLAASTAPLGAGATYTSTVQVLDGFARIVGAVYTDQSGTLYVEQSIDDGVNFDIVDQLAITGGTPLPVSVEVRAPLGRVRLVNGATAQTVLRLGLYGRRM